MIITRSFLSILSLITYTEAECFPSSYYRNCWIRRFPGLQVDLEASERKGARLLQKYHGYCAQNCSRTCCLTPNFSCNLAVFHYNTTQENDNCFHLHCPTLESCIFRQKVNAIIYKVTKGVDPDLLVFGKYTTTSAEALPYQTLSRLNTSEPSMSDKRQFNRPYMVTSSSIHPTRPASTPQTSFTLKTFSQFISTISQFVSTTTTTQDIQDTIPASLVQRSTTLKKTAQPSSNLSPDPIATVTKKWTSTATQNFPQMSSTFNPQESLMSQDKILTGSVTVSKTSKEPGSGLTGTSKSEVNAITRAPRTVYSMQTMPSSYSSTSTMSSSKLTTTTTPISFTNTQQSSRSMATTTTTLGTNYPYLSKTKQTLIPFIAITTMSQEVATQKPKVVTRSNISSWSQTHQNTSQTSASSVLIKGLKQSSTTNTKAQPETNAITKEDSTTSFSVTSTGHYSSPIDLLTDLGLNISPTPPDIIEESQPFPNDSKGYIIRNITTVNDPQPGGEGELTQVWHLAANTVLVAMGTCATLLCGCCSLLMALSWRGRKRRKGRYRTTLRGKKGSMRLIKYVIVRESS